MSGQPMNDRPLHKRAKFVGPMICALLSVGVFGMGLYAVLSLTPERMAIGGHIASMATMTVTALLALGTVIGGGATIHDAVKDRKGAAPPPS